MTNQQTFSAEAFITRPPAARLVSACSPPGLHDHTVWIHLVGELDRCTAPRLTEAIAAGSRGREALSSWAEHPAVGLDLSQLSFSDLGGISAIGEARTALLTIGFRLCLTRPQRSVLRLLDMAILHHWLPRDVECSQLPWPLFAEPNRLRPTSTIPGDEHPARPALSTVPPQRHAGQAGVDSTALILVAPPGDAA